MPRKIAFSILLLSALVFSQSMEGNPGLEIQSRNTDETPSTELPEGKYLYEDSVSPFYKGPVAISSNGSGEYLFKGVRLFVDGSSQFFEVTLRNSSSDSNLFRGRGWLRYPTKSCGTLYAVRDVEARVFKNSVNGNSLFYLRERGQAGLSCFASHGGCSCSWKKYYDKAQPKPYVNEPQE